MSSPKITRASLLAGAGSLAYGTTTPVKLFSKEAMQVTLEKETWNPTTSSHGALAPRLKDVTADIKFTPSGRLTQAILNILYPSALKTPVIGSRLFPATDAPLIVHGVDGTQLIFANTCPIEMPSLILSPAETAIGDAVFKALIKNNTSRETAGSLYTTASAAWAETFDPSKIITCPFKTTYGGTEIYTKDGVKVSFEIDATPVYVDGIGTVDYRLNSVKVTATFTPHNMSVADIMGAHAPEQALGTNLRQTKNLVVDGQETGTLAFTMYDCVLEGGDLQYQAEEPRSGELSFVANRNLSGSGETTTLGALFSLAINAAAA